MIEVAEEARLRRPEASAIPSLGEHTSEVLRELGYSSEDVSAISSKASTQRAVRKLMLE
jgi:crotonobetainyl-CoA:carnitine CoA-transferase CaiB-like acyl-CoA transferase